MNICIRANVEIQFLFLFFLGISRHVFKLDKLGLEIAQIAFPAALALTADPIASLVDTAFIGQIGIQYAPFVICSTSIPIG